MKHLSALMMLWAALILTREPDAGELQYGQRVLDNGSCPPDRFWKLQARR